MESSHLVIVSTSGKFITKFNVLCCISFKLNTILEGARGHLKDKKYCELQEEDDDIPWFCLLCEIRKNAELFPLA